MANKATGPQDHSAYVFDLGSGVISEGTVRHKSTTECPRKFQSSSSCSSTLNRSAGARQRYLPCRQRVQERLETEAKYNLHSYRHFSVTPYITICPSTETYFGFYLRGAMSAVTGIYLFRLLLNIIFFVLRSFCTLTNSAYHDEMPHDGISPVYTCKKHVPKIYFTIEMQPNILFKAISWSIHVYIHWL